MELLLSKLHSYKNILWDWNGTLLNDVDISYEIMISQMKEHGLKPLTVEELKDYFCFPIKKYYKDVGFPTDSQSFHDLAHSYLEAYKKKVKEKAQVFSGTKEMLSELKGKNQFMISASEESYLKELVSSYSLAPHFKKIYGLADSYGVSKFERCSRLLKENNLEASETLLIGDTSHDAEVAQKSGIQVLLLADGFQKYGKLKDLEVEVFESRYHA